MSVDFLILCLCVLALPALGQVVDTQYGPVRGQTMDVFNGRDTVSITTFKGIRFGQDTYGPNRFRNPVPPEPWTEIFDADTMGDACPQGGGTIDATHPDWDRFSEDCLHLNIYTPDVQGGPYPVMFWIYGGAFGSGANFQYPGHFLASHGVVVVTVNYRLSEFGFSFTGNEAVPGNAGLFDQKVGCQFVIDNIANFGGDPNKITVFGESAGAASASYFVISPHTKDMVQQAIMQSGAERNVWGIVPEGLNPSNNLRHLSEQLGCNRTDDFEMADCMRTLTTDNIRRNSSGGSFGPVVDGPGGYLPLPPAELRAAGDVMKGPIISGINRDDASWFLPGLIPELFLGCCNRTYYKRLLSNRLVGLLGFFLDDVTQSNIVEGMDHTYTAWPYIYNKWQNRQSLLDIATDLLFGLPWDQQVKAHSEVQDTYAYIFNYRSRNISILPEFLGVPHIAEIPYVWGHPLMSFPENEVARNDSEMYNIGPLDLIDWNQEDWDHIYHMQVLWTNFAKFGNPTPTPVPNPIGEETVWERFLPDEMNVMMLSNVTIETQVGWRQLGYAFWEDYMPYLVEFSGGNWNGTEPPVLDYTVVNALVEYFYEDLYPLFLQSVRDGSPLFNEFGEDW